MSQKTKKNSPKSSKLRKSVTAGVGILAAATLLSSIGVNKKVTKFSTFEHKGNTLVNVGGNVAVQLKNYGGNLDDFKTAYEIYEEEYGGPPKFNVGSSKCRIGLSKKRGQLGRKCEYSRKLQSTINQNFKSLIEQAKKDRLKKNRTLPRRNKTALKSMTVSRRNKTASRRKTSKRKN